MDSNEEPAEDSDSHPTNTSSRKRGEGGATSNNRHNSRGRGSRKTVCRRLWKLVRSLGGQAGLLIAYTLLGAWVMMTLEGPREDAQRQLVNTSRDRTATELKNYSLALKEGLINETEFYRRSLRTLLEFESQVHRSGLSSTSKKKWTFFGSVLFCFTTYTTIGYGNIAPATKAGRIATMLYATLGIPLALIILADLGRRFALGFKFVWGFVRRYYYTGYCRRARDKASSYDMNHSPAAVDDCERGDQDIRRQGSYRKVDRSADHVDAGYRQETEGGTAREGGGEGDVGGTSSDRRKTGSELTGEADPSRSPTGPSPVTGTAGHALQDVDQPGKAEVPVIGNIESEDTEAEDEHQQADDTDLQEEFKLPVPVAIGFIFAYIFLGAGMYIMWEDWTYLESFYFVFITTSTIGFGDVLPEHPNFFLLSCVYTFVGLAFVSMTVNVIMDFMTKTIHLAKHSVDSAKARAMAKAKAVRGIVTHVSSRAKHKVRKTFSTHKRKTKKGKRSSKEIEVGERSERSDSDTERKTRKSERSPVERGKRSKHSDSGSERKTRKAERSKHVERGERSKHSDSGSERKTRKAERSKHVERGERSKHSDSDSDHVDIPKVHVTDTAITAGDQSLSVSATANDVKTASHTGLKNGGHLVSSDGSVSPSVDSNTSTGYKTCDDGL